MFVYLPASTKENIFSVFTEKNSLARLIQARLELDVGNILKIKYKRSIQQRFSLCEQR